MENTIGIDIGGTKIEGVVFDGNNIIKELTIVTPKNKKDFLYSLRHLVQFLSADCTVKKIGIGVAGMVDPTKKIIIHSPNISYIDGLKLDLVFPDRQVQIDNDANCFTRSIMMKGEGIKYKHFTALTLGTGIGGGFVLNGHLYRGAHHRAGEIGHMVADYKSFSTLERVFLTAKHKDDYNHNFSLIARVFASCLADLARILDPEAFIIGGSIALKHHKQFFPQTKVHLRTLLGKASIPKILLSKLPSAPALGAALLWDR